MKKKHIRALAFFLTFLMTCSNLTPAFAAFDSLSLHSVPRTSLPSLERSITAGSVATNSGSDSDSDLDSDSDSDLDPDSDFESGMNSDLDFELATPSVVATSSNVPKLKSNLIELTDVSQLDSYFPDAAFRQAVFKDVQGGIGLTIDDILANYKGPIHASKKGIKDITGIHYLRKAGLDEDEPVDLSGNQITDWTPAAPPGGINIQTHYGSHEADGYHNSFWKLASNPFTRLPENFGGMLVIKQMATTSSTYEVPNETFTFVRNDTEVFQTTLNIKRCEQEVGGMLAAVKLVTSNVVKQKWGKPLLQIDSYTNETAQISHLTKSGTQMIGFGADEVFHYQTVDESDTITPGSVSFKYYIHPKFYVYDKIDLTSDTYKGSVELTKSDSTDSSKKLPGAQYELRTSPGNNLVGTYPTNSGGKLTVMDLAPGAYTFTEVSAPTGYIKDVTPIHFSIPNDTVSLTGGTQTVAPTSGAPVTAGTNEAFIAGPDSPDIALSHTQSGMKVEVTVTYSSIGAAPKDGKIPAVMGTPEQETFYSLAEAAADINQRKNKNEITGIVHVSVKHLKTASGAIKLAHTNSPNPNEPKNTTTSLNGTKTWRDEPGYTGFHPDLIIELYQNGSHLSGQDYLLHDGQETYEFHALPQYSDAANTKPYRYTVKERFVDPNEKDKFFCTQNGNDFTNTYIKGVRSIKGTKLWDDGVDQNGNPMEREHPAVTFTLLRDGMPFAKRVLSPTQDNYEFTNLLLRAPSGTDYQYSVREEYVPYYKSEKSGDTLFKNTYSTEPYKPSGGGGGGGGGHSPKTPDDSPAPPGGPGITPPTPDTPLIPEEPDMPEIPNDGPDAPDGPDGPDDMPSQGLPKTGERQFPLFWFTLASSFALAFWIQQSLIKRRNHN